MKQIWKDLLFAHWPVRIEQLQSYIPAGLELDLWDGTPWVSISPFRISPLRMRWLPPFPYGGRFLEMNVRTYVRRNGKPGIFFLTLEASNRLAVHTARRMAHLPYRHAAMSMSQEGSAFRYLSSRRVSGEGNTVFDGICQPVSPACFHAKEGTQLHWLTERYCLYTVDPSGQVLIGEIHHLPWPLQHAELDIKLNTYGNHFGIELRGEPSLLTYTKRLDVLFWPIKKS